MKKEYDDIVAHAKPKWVEEAAKKASKKGLKKNAKTISRKQYL